MTNHTAAEALHLDRVAKRFGSHVALDEISLTVARGEFVTMLGPSGSGKSTALRLIAGLEAPDSGAIRIGGREMANLPPHRRDCALVFQDLALFPHRTVRDNVGFGLAMRGRPRDETALRVQALLLMVGLGDQGGKRPSQLSGGQQQRVALARALAVEPAILLLDEPLGALDLLLRRQLQTELRAIQRESGSTFLHVTHDQQEALALSDRVVLMHAGRVAQVGAPEEIWERPASRFVAEFMGFRNIFPVTGSPGRPRVAGLDVSPAAGPVAPRYAAIRPERVRIGPPFTGAALLRGTVTARTYAGDAWTHEVRLGDGAAIEATTGRAYPEGEAVHLSLDPAHLVFLPE
jgi:ABC-type Fe3+/spermidine/putrescine transport system ATPase subunit